jgi:hypothetical protein
MQDWARRTRPSEVTMPDYLHSCFISYKHPPGGESLPAAGHFRLKFVEAFEERVNYYRQIALTTYRDVQLRADGGVHYPVKLARGLCRSVCMIAVLSPDYMESTWCRAEWQAMEELEQKRNIDKVDGCIIPILFRGRLEKVQELVGDRQLLDFRVDKPGIQLRTIYNSQRLEAIGERVARLARYASPVDCADFSINVGEDADNPPSDASDSPNPLV